MADVLSPATETELSEAIRDARGPFELVSLGTKRGLGRPVQAETTLDLSRFSGVIAYEPEELILETGPGARLSDITAMIAARGQELAFEPPDFSRILGSNDSGSIGGLMSCNLSGPRRIKAGAARDHVLGVRGATGTGEVYKSGARVVKNVTGYDLAKLATGAFGTLTAMTSIILKVLPRPETEETVSVEVQDDAEAVRLMSLAMQSSCEVSGASYRPGEAVHLRLEGIAPSVAYRRDQLARTLGRPVNIRAAENSAVLWRDIRDAADFAQDLSRPLWRLSLTPSEVPALIARLRDRMSFSYLLDWAGGLAWIEVPPSPDACAALIRGAMTSGHATLVRADTSIRAAVDVFHPQPEALSALSARVKSSFDPHGLFNPGRMYRVI